MKMYLYTVELAVLLYQLLLVATDGKSLPMWKTQLMHYHQWQGHFVIEERAHLCTMAVNSVQADDIGGASVSLLLDNNTTLAMSGYSQDDISIVFKTEDINKSADPFFDEFQFVVELLQYGNLHVFLGNITHPPSNSSSIRLQPQGSWMRNRIESSTKSVGLAVGISLFLFVVCSVIGIVILRWAIRKGYLRHVAMSYKNFRNPEPTPEPPVSFNNAEQERRTEEVNVHI